MRTFSDAIAFCQLVQKSELKIVGEALKAFRGLTAALVK